MPHLLHLTQTQYASNGTSHACRAIGPMFPVICRAERMEFIPLKEVAVKPVDERLRRLGGEGET